MSQLSQQFTQLRDTLASRIIEQHEAITTILLTLLSGGHVLVEDLPGTGKTVTMRSLARMCGGTFQRIQGLPDLLPSDVTGVSIFNEQSRQFEFLPGPIFGQYILFDEINRATPRTQSALLQAMAEGQVTVDRVTHDLEKPFFVMATQNPIEFEGTFPLPEAQLDRFATLVRFTPLSPDGVVRLLAQGEVDPQSAPSMLTSATIMQAQHEVRQMRVADVAMRYIDALGRASQSHPHVLQGLSPRALLVLMRLAQARAWLSEQDYIDPDTIKAIFPSVASHRLHLDIATTGNPAQRQAATKQIITEILGQTETTGSWQNQDARNGKGGRR